MDPIDDETRYHDRFGLLLALTSIAVAALSLFDLGRLHDRVASAIGHLTVTVFVGVTLLLAILGSGVSRRYRMFARILVGVGLATSATWWLSPFSASRAAPPTVPSIVWLVLSLFAPVLVVRRLTQHRRPSVTTLLGALSAYLLIALAFNFAFLALESLSDAAFFGTDQPTTNFMYFSLSTITTVGYGDLEAAQPLGRLMSMTEAVIGQVYLVTFVAMVVGLLVGQRQSLETNSGG